MQSMNHNYLPGGESRRPLSLFHLFTVLFKRKRLILAIWIATVATVAIGSLLMPRIYEASGTLLVERTADQETSILFRLYLQGPQVTFDWVNSEIEIMKSNPVAMRVIRELGLDRVSSKQNAATADSIIPIHLALRDFHERLSIGSTVQSNVITTTFEAKDPELAAAVANKVIDTYITYRSELYDESEAYRFFSNQLKLAEDELRVLEQNQATFKQQEDVVSVDDQRKILLTRLAEYESRLTAAQTRRIGKESVLRIIRRQLRSGEELNIPATETSDSPSREKHIARLRSELLDMEIRLERMLQRYKPTYEEVVNLQKEIDATKSKIEAEIQQIIRMEETAIRALAAEERVLQEAIESIKEEMRNFAQKEFEFSQLTRGIDDNRELFSMLLKQREEARLSLARLERGVKIKVISRAVTPAEPVRPRRKINVALAFILGGMAGIGLAFLLERFDHSIDNAVDLEKLTGLHVLGSAREIKNHR